MTQSASRNYPLLIFTDDEGVVVATAGDTSAAVGDDVSATPDVATALAGEPATGRADGQVSISVPVFAGADTVGAVMISAADDEIDSRASSRTRGLLAVAGISLAAAAVAALFMAGSVTGPLRLLRHSTERVAGGDFGERSCAPWPARSTR